MADLGQDLDQIEQLTRQIQIEWDKFFGGVEKKPPAQLRNQIEGLIRKYAYQEIRNNIERFRYQSLAARYNTFNDLWNKKLKAIEEGRPVGLHGTHVPPLPPPNPPKPSDQRPNAPLRPPALDEYRVKNPAGEGLAVAALFEHFVAARRAAGETAAVKLESFQKLIGQQTARILSERGAQAVDFRVETKDGKVTLKAKPVK
jgi:hypothetical protein